jgi:hypothetical protein
MSALKTDGKVQASFASVVEKITGYIQRTYEDGSEVAESLYSPSWSRSSSPGQLQECPLQGSL